jgi:hypothetical protein
LDTKMQVHFLLLHLRVSAAVPEPWLEAMADENHLALIYCFKDTSTTEYLFIEPHYINIVSPVCNQKCNQKHIPKKQHWPEDRQIHWTTSLSDKNIHGGEKNLIMEL